MLYPAWTPDYVLDHMSPLLFFKMLEKGRLIEQRKNFRHYYEMCRVGVAPRLPKEARRQIESYYWDGSLNDFERAAQARVVAQAQEDAKKTWKAPEAALDFLRGTVKR